MSGLNYNQINDTIVRDLNSSAAENDYCDELKEIVEAHWTTVRNQITINANMMVSEFNFRLASNRSPNYHNVKNFWPSPLHVSNYLINFVRGVLYYYFVRRRRSFRINLSPNMAIISTTGGPNSFIWASRSNHGILANSYLVHDVQSFNHFIDVILSNENLHEVMLANLSNLSAKYSDGFLAPLSLTFHITAVPSKMFGCTRLELSQHKCSGGPCDMNKCVWIALSSIFDVRKCGMVRKRDNKKKRASKAIAKKLEKSFLRWSIKKGYEKDVLCDRIGHLGMPENYMGLLEKFIQHSIILVSEKYVNMKKVVNQKMSQTTKPLRYFSSKTVSEIDYGDFIYLKTTNENHVQMVLDIEKYSKKFVCSSCTRCFSSGQKLENHHRAKVCTKKKFVGEKIVNFPIIAEKLVSEIDEFREIKIFKDSKYIHCLINAEQNSSISLIMQIDLKGTDQMVISKSFKDSTECASYIMKFSIKCAMHVLGERLAMHFGSLQMIENALNDYNSCEKAEIDTSKLNQLNIIKNDLMVYLSKYEIYLSIGQEDPKFVSSFMYELLSKVSEGQECENVHVKFEQNVLQHIAIDKFPLNFILLNKFAATFNEKRASPEMFTHLSNTVHLFKSNFDLNIVGCRNSTQIGKLLMATTVNENIRNAFFSPTVAFSNEIDKTFVSYGVLNAEASIAHEESVMKAALSIDFEKYYSRLLLQKKPEWMFIGLPHVYEKKGKTFASKRSRKSFSFANMVLSLIEFVCDSAFSISHLNGQERMRFGMLFDAIMQIGREEVYIEVQECIFHSCDRKCHTNEVNVTQEHKLQCETCKADEMAGDSGAHLKFLKPRLWKMKTNEHRNSIHAIKKDVTYEQDFKKNAEKAKLMHERSGKTIISVSECQVLSYWYKSTGEFMDSMNMPCNSDCREIQLCTLFEQITLQNFPLLRYGVLTHDKVISAIKAGDLNGFISCTTEAGEKTRQNLGVMKPFFYKDEDGASQTSHDVKDKIVSTLILRELLNNEMTSDFVIKDITGITEYRLSKVNPFHALKEPVFNAFKQYKQYTGFIQILKGSLNSAIGAFGISGNKYKKSYLMYENDIKAIQNLHNLSHGTQVNADKRLFHFASAAGIRNLKQLHMAIISNGISLFINFLLSWNKWILSEPKRFNTDGCLIFFGKSLTPETLGSSSLTSVLLDQYLRVTMNMEKANEYFQWKKRFFIALGVCPAHETEYLSTLVNGVVFKQCHNCINHVSKDLHYPIKLEFVGDVCVVMSVNKLSVFNSVKNEYLIKCSGSMDSFLSNIHTMNFLELSEKVFNSQ